MQKVVKYFINSFKLIILILFGLVLFINKTSAQGCTNADFSLNNFNGWVGSYGENDGAGNYTNITSGIIAGTLNSAPSNSGRQTIMNLSGTDPNTQNKLNVLPPGGSSSCRLGNDLVSGCIGGNAQAERISYSYIVSSTSCIFTYQYAIVLQDPGTSHATSEKPKFNIYVLNSAGTIIDPVCGQYEVIAGGGIPGFQTCSPATTVCSPSENVVWKDWTSVSIDLSGYIGQQITIQFTTYDCALGGHFGYAYLACSCGALQMIQACAGTSDVVSAPVGFATYQWSNGQTGNPITIANPVYGDTIKCVCTSFTGCAVTLSEVLQFSPVTFTLNSPTICSGDTANIAVNTSGTYNYIWSNSQTTSSISVTPTTTTIYSVSVTSSGGCSNTGQTTVTVNPLPVITATVKNESCAGYNDGSITVSVNSIHQPITYLWSNSLTTQNLTNLAAGTYTVVVTDTVGCISSKSFTVTSNPIVTLTTAYTDEHCGYSDGTATINATGGNGSFNYLWSTIPPKTTSSISGLAANTYTVTVTSGGCSTTAFVIISNIPGPSVSITNITNETCNAGNGGATALASGGTQGTTGYNYTWSSTPKQYTSSILNVHAGTYIVSVSDANGCIATNKVIITNSPIPTVAISNIIPANCGYSNGALTVTASGGTQPYQYLWNVSPSQTTPTASGIPQGIYSVVITDAIGCTTTVSGIVPQLPGPTASAISLPDICSQGKGSVSSTATGGHGAPYTFLWSTNPPQNTQNVNNLTSGIYSVTVSDGGCSNATSIGVSNIPGPNASFYANPKLLTVLDGLVSFQDQSIGNIINWQWDLGDGCTASTTQFNHIYPSEVGVHPVTLIITDNNGCKDTATDTIRMKDIFTFYIPNCFTPSNNDINDWFFPQGINWDPNYFEMYIYDRWGNLMFQSFNQNDKAWNGTLNNQGTLDDIIVDVYAYLIRVKELDGPKHQYLGKVTLLR